MTTALALGSMWVLEWISAETAAALYLSLYLAGWIAAVVFRYQALSADDDA